jgi:hypothetical protein
MDLMYVRQLGKCLTWIMLVEFLRTQVLNDDDDDGGDDGGDDNGDDVDNCNNRWSATDYKGYSFNWRKLGKVDSWEQQYLAEMDITIMVHFKKSEDLMLYLLSWPSEVLLND